MGNGKWEMGNGKWKIAPPTMAPRTHEQPLKLPHTVTSRNQTRQSISVHLPAGTTLHR